MNIHLRTIYGCDRRFNLYLQTLKLSHSYFKTIRILTTCSDKDYQEAKQFEDISSNIKVEQFKTPFYGDFEPICRNLFWDVPEDEWIHMLDSDERPTYDCLTSMQWMIEDALKEGVDICRLPSIQHVPSPNATELAYTLNGYENVYKGIVAYCEPSLFKFNKRMFYLISSYGGGHSMFARLNKVEKLYIKPTLHLKSFTNWNQSIPLQGWFNPCIHTDKPTYSKMLISREFQEFTKLKIETGCHTATQFMDVILFNPEIKEKFRILFLTFKDSIFPQFMHMYNWALDGLSPQRGEQTSYCGHPCCKYGDIQL